MPQGCCLSDAGAILPCSGQTLQGEHLWIHPGLVARIFSEEHPFHLLGSLHWVLDKVDGGSEIWSLGPDIFRFNSTVTGVAWPRTAVRPKKGLIFLCGTWSSQNYNYCNTTTRSTPEYDNVCITETSNMSRKQQIVHSSQLRRKTKNMIKAMSEVQGRAKETTSETISRSEAKRTMKQILHLKSSFHLPAKERAWSPSKLSPLKNTEHFLHPHTSTWN